LSESPGRAVDDPFTASKRYAVVYADPPWVYRDQALSGQRGVHFKYPVLGDRDIAALPVREILAPDAALFLWVTWPKLPEVLPVIEAWGFRYRTVAFVWVKRTRITGALAWGMGSWTRANTEPCLLATLGRPKRISAGVHQVVEAPSLRHSQKPAIVRERIEQLFGDVPRIELFARERAAGWDAWGNDPGLAPVPATGTPVAAQAAPAGATARGSTRAPDDAPRERVLAELRRSGRITRAEAAQRCGLDPQHASRLLRELVHDGHARRHGVKRWAWYEPCD